MRTSTLRRQHQAAIDLIERLRSAARSPGVLDAVVLTDLLAKLAGLLRIHFAMEDRVLYPAMLACPDDRTSRTAKAFQSEMGGISAAFAAFMDRWRARATIQSDPSIFIDECHPILAALVERIEREDHELYTLADVMFTTKPIPVRQSDRGPLSGPV